MCLATPAFALTCKSGTSLNSDECWTEFRVDPDFTLQGQYVVSRGQIVMVSYQEGAVTSNDGYVASLTYQSADENVLGVVQQDILSTDNKTALGWRGRALTLGRGAIKVQTGSSTEFVSGDTLGVKTSNGYKGIAEKATSDVNAHRGRARLATALENSREGSSDNVYAYIHL